MEHSSEPRENISQFEKLLAALAAAEVDFAVVGGIAVIHISPAPALFRVWLSTNPLSVRAGPDFSKKRILARKGQIGRDRAPGNRV